jgi:hypothetical protein
MVRHRRLRLPKKRTKVKLDTNKKTLLPIKKPSNYGFFSEIFRIFYSYFRKIFYFLTETLTRSELFNLILFIILFVYTDRYASKSIKYDKTKAPNLLCRVLAFLAYIPIWIQLASPSFFLVSIKFNFRNEGGGLALKTFGEAMLVEVNAINKILHQVHYFFNGKIAFDIVYYLFLYHGIRFLCKYVKQKSLRLPMFLRYHLMYAAILTSFGPTVKWLLSLLLDIVYESKNLGELDSTNVHLYIAFLSKVNWAWLIICVIFIGRGSWLAARGISFRSRGFIDILIRSNLSVECLYPDEKWSDYGMDDMQDLMDTDDDS